MHSNSSRWLLTAILIFGVPYDTQASFDEGVRAYQNKQYTAALREFEELGRRGLAIAQGYVGVMYALGQGVEKDLPKAITWFERAAKQGNAEAALTLGSFAYHGEGRDKNLVDAYAWYSLAAAGGNDQATDILARLTIEMSNKEIRRGQAKAEKLYRKLNRSAWETDTD